MTPMSEFIFLYRKPSRPAENLSPKQIEERTERFKAWVDKLQKGGNLVNLGQPFADTGGGVVRDAKGTVTDGPYAETKDIVIGYSVIAAKDFAEAVRLTEGLPIFDDEGGMVEVRPILKM
jgi:hypothetical protein